MIPGPAVAIIGRKLNMFRGDNTSCLVTVNNNSPRSAYGTVNVVDGGPRFTSIHDLRKLSPAGGPDMPVLTVPAATNATTRIAVGCIVASRRGQHGFIYISPRSVPRITFVSTSVVSNVPPTLGTTANISTLARTVRKCVAHNT